MCVVSVVIPPHSCSPSGDSGVPLSALLPAVCMCGDQGPTGGAYHRASLF